MLKDNSDEIFPVVDESGRIIGQASRGECHGGSGLLHPVVHLHLVDVDGALYLQKRPEWKDIQPGRWDTAVGGHVGYGESIENALMREVREEIGLTDFTPTFVTRYVFASDRERELVHVFFAKADHPAEICPSDELAGGRFWSREEIESSLGKGVFTPNFENEYVTVVAPRLS